MAYYAGVPEHVPAKLLDFAGKNMLQLTFWREFFSLRWFHLSGKRAMCLISI